MAKILLIHTGGTLMMKQGEDPRSLEPDTYIQDLVKELPVLQKIGQIDTKVLFNMDSGDMCPHHWVSLAEEIYKEIGFYDGVVVVHGTDTMTYTASALAFLLPGLDKPVVLTGSQRPLFDIRTDARSNLVDAFYVATLPVPEVGISFSHKFFRGCRTIKYSAWGFDAFASPCCLPLVELGIGCQIGSHVLPPRIAGAFDPRIEPNVLCVRTFPGLNPDFLAKAIESGVKGIVIQAYGTGNIPHHEGSLAPTIRMASDKHIPVVIVSQCVRGAVDLLRYPGSKEALKAGAIPANDMTTEAAVTKLMVSLGRAPVGKELEFVQNAFSRALLGEMTIEQRFD